MFDESVFLPQGRKITWIEPQALAQRETQAAYAYWRRLRGPRRWPARQEMKLREAAALLPYMSLVKVIAGGADFEHRIVGDTMVQAFSVPIQNRRFSDIAADAPMLIESSLVLFRKVVALGEPIAWRQRVVRDELRIICVEAEMVLLPFGADDDGIDHIAAFGVHNSCPGL